MLNEDVVIKCLMIHDKGFQILCMDLLTELTAHPSSLIFCILIRNVAWVLRWKIFPSGSLELL